jgi:urea transporter
MFSSFYSIEEFRALSMVTLGGIAIFYGLGEFYRRWLIKNNPEKTNWLVALVLVIGLAVFIIGGVFGGVFLLLPLNIPSLSLVTYAIVSIFIGFIVSYLLLRVWKSRDIAV